jgi:hypothetical protein
VQALSAVVHPNDRCKVIPVSFESASWIGKHP